MVSGSLGSGLHGEPRASRDVDVVIDPDEGGAQPIFRSTADVPSMRS